MSYVEVDEKAVSEKHLHFLLDKQKIKNEVIEGKLTKVKIICKVIICDHDGGLHIKFLYFKAPICGNENLIEIFKTFICQDKNGGDNANNWYGYFKKDTQNSFIGNTTESVNTIDEFEEDSHFKNVNIREVIKMLNETEEKFKLLGHHPDCFHPEDYGFDIARRELEKYAKQTGGKKNTHKKTKTKSKSKSKSRIKKSASKVKKSKSKMIW